MLIYMIDIPGHSFIQLLPPRQHFRLAVQCIGVTFTGTLHICLLIASLAARGVLAG